MSQLTNLKALIRRPIRRSKIVRLTNKEFGVGSRKSKRIILASDLSRDLNRGKRRKNKDARITHERDMFVYFMQYARGNPHVERHLFLVATAIFLHDLWEENADVWPLYKIAEVFGFDAKQVVSAVSKPPRIKESELVSAAGSRIIADRVRQGGVPSMMVKILDRSDFFLKPFKEQSLPENRRKLVWKVAQTLLHIQPMALELGLMAIELELLVADCIRKYKITNEELAEFV